MFLEPPNTRLLWCNREARPISTGLVQLSSLLSNGSLSRSTQPVRGPNYTITTRVIIIHHEEESAHGGLAA